MNLFSDGVFVKLPVIDTPRLRLRPMTMADAADVFEYSRDPKVAEHVLWDPHRNIGDSKAYLRYILRQYRSNEPSSFGIEFKRNGRLIGTIGFIWWNQQFRTAEVGYSINRAYWNQGLTTEALKAVIHFGFEEMRLFRVEAQHEIDNPASGAVMTKAGMRKEGVLRGRIYNKGRHADVCLYAILRGDPRL